MRRMLWQRKLLRPIQAQKYVMVGLNVKINLITCHHNS